MSRRRMAAFGTLVSLAIGLAARGWTTAAQVPVPAEIPLPAQVAPTREARATPGRFEFLVVESFDAQYQGDTPGHIGRGGLGRAAPRVALGDAVYRGDARVGKVSRLIWNEAKESLEVEFDPENGQRIQIGDPVWIRLGPDAKGS